MAHATNIRAEFAKCMLHRRFIEGYALDFEKVSMLTISKQYRLTTKSICAIIHLIRMIMFLEIQVVQNQQGKMGGPGNSSLRG